MKTRTAALKLVVVSAALTTAAASQACSVCIAHAIGAGLHALGAQTLEHGKFVMGVSYTSFSKSNDGDLAGTTEKHDQSEVSLDLLTGLSDHWMLRANVPYEFKRLKVTGEDAVKSQGLGDISLGVTYQVPPRASDKVLVATTFDVKLPTGANNLKDSAGDRQEEHTQVGTGSTDFSAGFLATMEGPKNGLWFAGLHGRWNGRNGTGYQYGKVLFYNLGYSFALTPGSSIITEFNGRLAEKDRTETGEKDPNSGGHFGYLSLSYRRNLGSNFGLVASYQLPIIRSLNGSQSETGLLSVGISRSF